MNQRFGSFAFRGLAWGVALSLFGFGCGGDVPKDIHKGLVKVTGKVTFDGKAVTKGTISFVPADGKGEGSSSAIDGSGNYSLAQSLSAPGAMPGEYKVFIVAKDGVATMDKDGKPVEPKSLIPEKFGKIDTSGLTASVKAGQSNSIPFDLKP